MANKTTDEQRLRIVAKYDRVSSKKGWVRGKGGGGWVERWSWRRGGGGDGGEGQDGRGGQDGGGGGGQQVCYRMLTHCHRFNISAMCPFL